MLSVASEGQRDGQQAQESSGSEIQAAAEDPAVRSAAVSDVPVASLAASLMDLEEPSHEGEVCRPWSSRLNAIEQLHIATTRFINQITVN